MDERKKPVGLKIFAILNLCIMAVSFLGLLPPFLRSSYPLRLFKNPYVIFHILIILLLLISAVGLLKKHFIWGYLGSNVTILLLAGNIIIGLIFTPVFVSKAVYFSLAYLAVFFFFINFRYRGYFQTKPR